MKDRSVKIVVSGDYHIYGAFDEFIKLHRDHDLFDNNINHLISSADLGIFNLEDPITESKEGAIKFGPYGVGSVESLKPIQKAGFKLAAFATNHTYDMKNKGIRDTMDACKEYGINTTGSGFTPEEARKIYYKEIEGSTFAVLNFARKEFNVVTNNHGGANPLDAIDNARDIIKAKKNSDVVIAIVHEGLDLFELPYPELVKQMRFYAEMGADAILVHHARLISGYEVYQGVPIFYGLGNLIHMSKITKEHEGLLVELDFKKGKEIKFKLHPVVLDVDKVKVSMAKGDQQKEILDRVKTLSEIIADEKRLKEKWKEFVLAKSTEYLNIASGLPRIIFRIARKAKLLPLYNRFLLMNRKKYLAMWNTARCQAHFEAYNLVMTDLFKEDEK